MLSHDSNRERIFRMNVALKFCGHTVRGIRLNSLTFLHKGNVSTYFLAGNSKHTDIMKNDIK